MTKASREHGPWSRAQVREFVKLMRKNVGEGWRFMTEEVRMAFVAQAAFAVARAQNAETVEVKSMDWLLVEMEIEAGLVKREDVE